MISAWGMGPGSPPPPRGTSINSYHHHRLHQQRKTLKGSNRDIKLDRLSLFN